MNEWKKVKLGDCIREVIKKTTENNQYEVLSVTKDGIFSQKEFFKKQIASENNIGYKIIRKNNLVFSTMNLWMGSLDVLTNYEIGIVSPAYKIFEFYEKLMLPEYGNYFMKSHYMLKQYKNCSEQGASVVRRNLDLKALLNIEINIPPIKEQKKIIEILKKIDSIIDKYKKLLEEKNQFIKSQFLEILRSKEFQMIELDECIESILKGPFGSDMKKSLYVPKANNTYKVYIQINVIEKNEDLGDYWISREYFDNKMNRYEVFPGDFIITCDGTLGKIFQLDEKIEKGVISSSLMKITLNKEMIDSSYFEFLWNNYLLNKLLKKVGNTALKHLPSAKVIQKSTIPYLNMEEQKSFAKFIRLIDEQKILLEMQKQNYENLKKGLMQQLLTGKVKVNV